MAISLDYSIAAVLTIYRAFFVAPLETTGALSALWGFAPRKGSKADMMTLTMDGQDTMIE